MLKTARNLRLLPYPCRCCVCVCPGADCRSTGFTFGWLPPLVGGGSPILTYTVWVLDTVNGTALGPWSVPANVPRLQLRLDGAVTGRSYNANVTATNVGVPGAGPPSSPLSVMPSPPPPPPPTNVRGHNASYSEHVSVSWNGVDGGAGVGDHLGYSSVLYTVTAVPGGASMTTTNTVANVSGLTNGVAYFFRVAAVADGQGSPSSQLSPYPCYPGTPPPSTPTGFRATGGNGTLTVAWATPAVGNVVNYFLTATGPGLPGGYAYVPDIPPSATSWELEGVVDGANYTVQLVAFSCSGVSAAATAWGVPDVGVPGPPTNVTVAAGADAVTVSWAPPGGSRDALLYNVWLVSVTGTLGAAPVPLPVPHVNLSCCATTFDALIVNATYVFGVNASNVYGQSGPAADSGPAVPGAGKPAAPTVGMAWSPAANVVVVNWTALLPEQDGGSPLTGYVATLAPADNGTTVPGLPVVVQASASNTSAWFLGVPLNLSVVATVCAASAQGVGPASKATAAVVSNADPAGAPAGVVTQVLSCTGDQCIVTVSWLPPASPGGVGVPPLLSYDVFTAGNATSAPVAPTQFSLSATFGGVPAGVPVSFVVSARNAWQVPGPRSVPSAPVTPLANAPAAPTVTSVAPDTVTPGCFAVSWAVNNNVPFPASNVTVLVFNCSVSALNLATPVATFTTSNLPTSSTGAMRVRGGGRVQAPRYLRHLAVSIGAWCIA